MNAISAASANADIDFVATFVDAIHTVVPAA